MTVHKRKNIFTMETYWRPIEDSLETNMSDQSPTCLIGDRHVSGKIYIYASTCLNADQHAQVETHRRPTYWINDPFGDQHAWSVTSLAWINSLIGDPSDKWQSPIRHVGLQSGMLVSDDTCRSLWVSNEACQFRMGLWSGISVFYESLIRDIGLSYQILL